MFEIIQALFIALNNYEVAKAKVDISKEDFYERLREQGVAFNEVHNVLRRLWAATKVKFPNTWYVDGTRIKEVFGASGHYQQMMWEMR